MYNSTSYRTEPMTYDLLDRMLQGRGPRLHSYGELHLGIGLRTFAGLAAYALIGSW
jgi:hypothetical protein